MHRLLTASVLAMTVLTFIACGDSPTPETIEQQPQRREASDEEMVRLIWRLPPDRLAAINAQVAAFEGTQEEKDALLWRLLEADGGSLTTTDEGLQAEGAYPGGLTAAEIRLCAAHPFNCSRTKEISNNASAVAAQQFQDGSWLGRQDAFRHAYWNAVMTVEISEAWARDFSTAHESETPRGSDKTMDLRNNEIGRSIGRGNSGVSRATLSGIVARYVNNGFLWKVCGDSTTGFLVATNRRC